MSESINNGEKEQPNCPDCHTNGLVVPYCYGLATDEMLKKSNNNEIKLGGCMMRLHSRRINCTEATPEGEMYYFYPRWYCRYCKCTF